MFSSKMVILKGIWTFLLSLYHFTVMTIRCSSFPWPSWHSVLELAFQDLNHMGRMVRMDIYLVADVLDQSVSIWSSSVMWRRRLYSFSILSTPSTLAFMKPGSVPHYASGILVNFTPRLQLRGGVERIPGFMCRDSWDAVRVIRQSHYLSSAKRSTSTMDVLDAQ